MSECNAIIEANNEIYRLKKENEKLNALCVKYGFEMGKLEEENEQLKHLIKIATTLIGWNTVPQVRREWEKHLNKLGDVE